MQYQHNLSIYTSLSQENQLSIAFDTARLIQKYMLQGKFDHSDQVETYIEYIKRFAKRLNKDPLNFVIPNVIRRIIAIIRADQSEDDSSAKIQSHQERKFKELKDAITRGDYKPKSSEIETQSESIPKSTRQESIEENSQNDQMTKKIATAIDKFLEELEYNQEEINKYASQHFFSNEVIMVYEFSQTILQFLLQAEKQKNLEIIVVQNETSNLGLLMAQELSQNDLNVTVIPFTNAFALMQRTSKVLLGVDAVFKNGGLLMHPGTLMISLAAKQFSVPVIALSGIHKITPKYAFEQNTYNDLLSPLEVSAEAEDLKSTYIGVKYDYVPPEYITLYITNMGQYTPENIYQLFNDCYDPQDEDI